MTQAFEAVGTLLSLKILLASLGIEHMSEIKSIEDSTPLTKMWCVEVNEYVGMH